MIGNMRQITRLETLDISAGVPALDFRRSSQSNVRKAGDIEEAS
jgi:hypothetical protein